MKKGYSLLRGEEYLDVEADPILYRDSEDFLGEGADRADRAEQSQQPEQAKAAEDSSKSKDSDGSLRLDFGLGIIRRRLRYGVKLEHAQCSGFRIMKRKTGSLEGTALDIRMQLRGSRCSLFSHGMEFDYNEADFRL